MLGVTESLLVRNYVSESTPSSAAETGESARGTGLAQWLGRWNRGLWRWNAGSSKGIEARAVKLGVWVEKAGTQAVEPRIRAGNPETGGRTVPLDGETVDSGSSTRIWDRQPELGRM